MLQLNRKVMMTDADLERTDKKADAAEEYVTAGRFCCELFCV